mmetsp:Transcript_4717/g.8360  ORF Transcript_4717/g.8360 Transcript_4717/m.8360 type:complete len:257 (-) Transcript_4717:26-796(-)
MRHLSLCTCCPARAPPFACNSAAAFFWASAASRWSWEASKIRSTCTKDGSKYSSLDKSFPLSTASFSSCSANCTKRFNLEEPPTSLITTSSSTHSTCKYDLPRHLTRYSYSTSAASPSSSSPPSSAPLAAPAAPLDATTATLSSCAAESPPTPPPTGRRATSRSISGSSRAGATALSSRTSSGSRCSSSAYEPCRATRRAIAPYAATLRSHRFRAAATPRYRNTPAEAATPLANANAATHATQRFTPSLPRRTPPL